MPNHLRADPGDYAPHVLCPGDPQRATSIAEDFFDPGSARLVNSERGLLGYTGTFEGAPISVQTTGMGCPSAGIVIEELIMLGATRLVRVGTCGGLREELRMGDLVVGLSATTDDTTPLQVAEVDRYSPTASFGLVRRAVELAEAAGQRVHVGPVVTSGLFYSPDPAVFTRWRRLGHLGVEMEAAMVYTLAALHEVEALAMMTVTDVITDHGHVARISDEELARGVATMVRLACRVVTS